MTTNKAREILREYTSNITHVGEVSEAISYLLYNSLTWDELKDIVLDVPCSEPETHFVKGEILGTIGRKIAENKKGF